MVEDAYHHRASREVTSHPTSRPPEFTPPADSQEARPARRSSRDRSLDETVRISESAQTHNDLSPRSFATAGGCSQQKLDEIHLNVYRSGGGENEQDAQHRAEKGDGLIDQARKSQSDQNEYNVGDDGR